MQIGKLPVLREKRSLFYRVHVENQSFQHGRRRNPKRGFALRPSKIAIDFILGAVNKVFRYAQRVG